jgi:hypothetical protein
MAKSKKAPNKRKQAQASSGNKPVSRRSILQMAPYIAAGVAVVGGVGAWGTTTVLADLAEQDLSILGTGTPTIVQVHDPSCPICLGLQKETRAALATLDDGALEYRVASITSDTGIAFANKHNSSHATLLFFDGTGDITQRITGATDRDVLRSAFLNHISDAR